MKDEILELRKSFLAIYENPNVRDVMEQGIYLNESKFIDLSDIDFEQFGNYSPKTVQLLIKELSLESFRWIKKTDLE